MLMQHSVHGRHATSHSLPFTAELWMWMAMVAAMMLPLVLDGVRQAAENSLWNRRHRAMAGFLLGYLAMWFLVGLLPVAFRQFPWAHNQWLAAGLFLAAGLWLQTPWHRRALITCHRTFPLSPSGWRADWDCLRYGTTVGGACVRSCWLFMVACLTAGHAPAAMVAGMMIGYFMRWKFRAGPRAPMTGAFAVAGYYALTALLH
jgi:Predicted metal-binding integral membrane protein (DUF2182)